MPTNSTTTSAATPPAAIPTNHASSLAPPRPMVTVITLRLSYGTNPTKPCDVDHSTVKLRSGGSRMLLLAPAVVVPAGPVARHVDRPRAERHKPAHRCDVTRAAAVHLAKQVGGTACVAHRHAERPVSRQQCHQLTSFSGL